MARLPRRARDLLACASCALAFACAPKQKIALDCVPKDVIVYVDGEALKETPAEIELRSDRPHTLFVKGEGYRPEMVVLDSREEGGAHRLTPSEVCVQLRYVGVRREIDVEVEEKGAETAPARTLRGEDVGTPRSDVEPDEVHRAN